MIEDGNADFERIQHAHAVDLGQDVGDHIALSINIKNLVDRILCGRLRKVAAQNVTRIVAAVQDLPKIVREERGIALKCGDERKSIDVTLLPWE